MVTLVQAAAPTLAYSEALAGKAGTVPEQMIAMQKALEVYEAERLAEALAARGEWSLPVWRSKGKKP